MSRTAVIITLGCRLNHADTALLSARLQNAGYELRDNFDVEPDLILLNSCAITAEAERKSRQQIRKFRREHPAAQIIVAGCAAEVNSAQFQECGADLVLTNPDKKLFPVSLQGKKSREETVESFCEKSLSFFPFRSRAFIKIQEGCDNFCSYCIVPYVRGASRSRNFAECIRDCRNAVDSGYPEIVLTGVNTCNYFDDGKDLAALIKEVAAIPGDFRIRLSSTEPHPDKFDIPELMSDPKNKLCRFLHLSMQHGSNKILRAMNRNYNAEDFIALVEKIRKNVPDIHIGTDFIVGFPGETDSDFNELMLVAEKVKFANIHSFIYSVRPGTPAAKMSNQIPAACAKERMQKLSALARKSSSDFAASQTGKTLPVIFEQNRNGILHGWSDNYLAVTAPEDSFPLKKIVYVTANEKNLPENLQNSPLGDIL